jgi:hypothetical protein
MRQEIFEEPAMREDGRSAGSQIVEPTDRVTAGIVAKYDITSGRLAELRQKYTGLKIVGPLDKVGYTAVASAKSELVKLRGAVEVKRKELNADALEYSRKVNGEAKRITAELESIEAPLAAEKARIDAEIQAEKDKRQQEINDRVNARMAALNAVNGSGSLRYELLPAMPEADFQAHLAVATAKYEEQKKIFDEAEAELKRLQKVEEEAKAREAAALHLQRLEMAEKQREIDRQRQEMAEKEAAIRADFAALEKAKTEAADRAAREESTKAHTAEIEKARKEAAANAIAEAEAAQVRKAQAEAEAREKADKEAAQARARASDREKLDAFLSDIRKVRIPNIRDTKLQGVLVDFANAIVAFDKAIR